MKELHLVGFTDDRDGLIFATRSGTASGGFKVVIDEALVDHVEELRAELGLPPASPGRRTRTAPRGRSALSPREMQSRLRGGLSIAEVAEEAGVDPSWVERFAAPVLAEQANAVDQAVRFPLSSTRRGTSGTTLADAVAANLADRGLPVTERTAADGWSAYHHHGTQWRVRFTFRQRGRELQAEWLADLADKTLTAVNRLGTELGYSEPEAEATVGEGGHDGPPVRALRGRVAADARVRPSPVAGLARSAAPAPAEARKAKVAEPGPTPAEKQTAKKAAARERAAAKRQDDREKAAAKKVAARQREAERKAARAEKEAAKKEAAKVKAAAKQAAERERAAARRLAAQESERLRKADLAAKEAAKREAAEQRAAAEPPLVAEGSQPALVVEEPQAPVIEAPVDAADPPAADPSSADLTTDPTTDTGRDEGQQLTFDEPKAAEEPRAAEEGAPKFRSKLSRRRHRRAAEEPTAEDHPTGPVPEVPFSGATPPVPEPELPHPPAFPALEAVELADDAPDPGTVPAIEPAPGTVPAIDPAADAGAPPEPPPAPVEAPPSVVEQHTPDPATTTVHQAEPVPAIEEAQPAPPAPEPPAPEPLAPEAVPVAAVPEPEPRPAELPPHLVPLPAAQPDDAPAPTRPPRRARRSPALREGGPRRPLRSTQEARAVAARRKEQITGIADPPAGSETNPTIRATRAADAGERAAGPADDTKAADRRPDPSP